MRDESPHLTWRSSHRVYKIGPIQYQIGSKSLQQYVNCWPSNQCRLLVHLVTVQQNVFVACSCRIDIFPEIKKIYKRNVKKSLRLLKMGMFGIQMLAFDEIFNFGYWKTVECTSNWDGVSAHVLENNIVAKAQFWQLNTLRDLCKKENFSCYFSTNRQILFKTTSTVAHDSPQNAK